jgi:hypothetical protein
VTDSTNAFPDHWARFRQEDANWRQRGRAPHVCRLRWPITISFGCLKRSAFDTRLALFPVHAQLSGGRDVEDLLEQGLGVSDETAALVLEAWSIYSQENWLGPARRAWRSDTARPIEDVLVRDVAAVATEAFGLDELGTDSFVGRLFHAVRPRDPCGLARDGM